MKRIVLLTDGWRRFVSSAWISGIMQFINEHGNEYSLTEFHCWGNWSLDEGFNDGEYAIFSLPDFRHYDGILVDFTNMKNPRVLERLCSAIIESGLPAISLCDYREGIHCIRTDNVEAIRTLFAHLYDVHHCRSFHFAGSSIQDSESMDREAAFVACCREKDIPVTEDMITEQDYTAETGVIAAKRFFRADSDGIPDDMIMTKSGHLAEKPIRPIPHAFICANDNIAVGLAIEMKRHGYRCPEDFLITGFDNLDKAMYFKPQITTVSLNREHIAYEAAVYLSRMMNGESIPKNIYLHADPIFTESCGCPNSGLVDYRSFLSWQVEDSISSFDQTEDLSRFSLQLNPSLSIRELMFRVMKKYAQYDQDGVYIALDDRIESGKLASGYYDSGRLRLICGCERHDNVETISKLRHECKTAGSCDTCGDNALDAMHGTTDIGNGMHTISVSSKDTMVRDLYETDGGSCSFVIPLHIKDRIAGVIAIQNPRFLVQQWRIFELQDIVLRALAEWDSNRELQDSLKALRTIYDTDSLTGMYTKAAVKARLLPWFLRALQTKQPVGVLFMDIDHFKEINDNYGHDHGDQVLKQASEVIRSHMPEDSFSFRYGGDEFVSVFLADTQGSVDFGKNMYDAFLAEGLSVSVGVSETKEEDFGVELRDRSIADNLDHSDISDRPDTLDHSDISDHSDEANQEAALQDAMTIFDRLLREADSNMYVTKRRHHAGHI